MKVNGSINPPRFTLEANPRRPNFRLARFHENAIETENGWEYDEYCLEFPTSDTLKAEIEAHYADYLKQAMEAEGASEAEYISVARNAALRRIDGKCSAAIYSGVTVSGKRYSLTLVSQQNLKTAQDKITAGATSVIFAADGEEPTVHTAEQITAISNAAYEWGVVNTSYYAKLQKWIARETDTTILNAIDYGSALPDDLMSELATLLAGAGIDLAKYSTMLGG
jgi:hypothetical protein